MLLIICINYCLMQIFFVFLHKKKEMCFKFTMFNKSGGEEVYIYLRKELITSVVEYPQYCTVHYSTGTSFDGSYKVNKNFNIKDIFE